MNFKWLGVCVFFFLLHSFFVRFCSDCKRIKRNPDIWDGFFPARLPCRRESCEHQIVGKMLQTIIMYTRIKTHIHFGTRSRIIKQKKIEIKVRYIRRQNGYDKRYCRIKRSMQYALVNQYIRPINYFNKLFKKNISEYIVSVSYLLSNGTEIIHCDVHSSKLNFTHTTLVRCAYVSTWICTLYIHGISVGSIKTSHKYHKRIASKFSLSP